MTGLASMLSNYPKAEKDRAELPDSLSSDSILTEKWLRDAECMATWPWRGEALSQSSRRQLASLEIAATM